MKSIFTLLILFASFSGKAAADPGVSETVLKSFETTFAEASGVQWTVSTSLYKAEFVLDGQHIRAFFNQDGELLAMSRNVSSMQIPVLLKRELKKNYAGYWITDLFEMANEQEIAYYVTLEDAENRIILKSTDFKTWKSYSETIKE